MTRYEEIFARHARMIHTRVDTRLSENDQLILCGVGLPGEFAETVAEVVGSKEHLLETGDWLWYNHLLTMRIGFDFLQLTNLAVGSSKLDRTLQHNESMLVSFMMIGGISDIIKKVAVTKRKEFDEATKRVLASHIAASMVQPLGLFYADIDSTEARLDKVADILLANIEKLEERSNEKYT